jgi:hypothetical protein
MNKSPRVSVLEEASFHESDIATVSTVTDMDYLRFSAIYLKVIVAVLIIFRNPQTGGMRIQNIARAASKSKLFAAFLASFTVVLLSDSTGTLLSRLKISMIHRERARGLFSLVTMLLFISGSRAEVRPELIFSGTIPLEDEQSVSRQTSSEFIARFLLLDTLATFSFSLFPYFDIENRLKGLIRRFAPRLVDDRLKCSSCSSETIVYPQQCTPCGHIYCYYCVKSEVVPFRCYKCNNFVTNFSISKLEDVF